MRRVLAAVAVTMAIACGLARATPNDFDGPPYAAIRGLQMLQDRITAGDTVAAVAHAKALAYIGDRFAKEQPTVWSDVRNARALALYLFSGGNAPLLADAVPRDAIAKEAQSLCEGALAYGLGRDDDARNKLMSIEPLALPTVVGGHLALVQATLIASSDKAKAIELLDLARLLEPGTLVEEAALRKELLLLGTQGGQLAKFDLLARRYAGTFRRSLYADNFREMLTEAAVEAAASDSVEGGARLAKIVGNLEPQERRRLFLRIARKSLIGGHLTMATFASEEAGRLLRKGEKDEARANLYFGAAAIVGPRYEQGVRTLAAIDDAKLDPGDRALRQSAIEIAEMIRKPSFATRPEPSATQAATITGGERALAASEDILKSVEK